MQKKEIQNLTLHTCGNTVADKSETITIIYSRNYERKTVNFNKTIISHLCRLATTRILNGIPGILQTNELMLIKFPKN